MRSVVSLKRLFLAVSCTIVFGASANAQDQCQSHANQMEEKIGEIQARYKEQLDARQKETERETSQLED